MRSSRSAATPARISSKTLMVPPSSTSDRFQSRPRGMHALEGVPNRYASHYCRIMTTNEPPPYPGDSEPGATPPPSGSGESPTSDLPSYGSVPPPAGETPPPPPPPPPAPGGSAEGFSATDAIGWGWRKFTENVGPILLGVLIVFVVTRRREHPRRDRLRRRRLPVRPGCHGVQRRRIPGQHRGDRGQRRAQRGLRAGRPRRGGRATVRLHGRVRHDSTSSTSSSPRSWCRSS